MCAAILAASSCGREIDAYANSDEENSNDRESHASTRLPGKEHTYVHCIENCGLVVLLSRTAIRPPRYSSEDFSQRVATCCWKVVFCPGPYLQQCEVTDTFPILTIPFEQQLALYRT